MDVARYELFISNHYGEVESPRYFLLYCVHERLAPGLLARPDL